MKKSCALSFDYFISDRLIIWSIYMMIYVLGFRNVRIVGNSLSYESVLVTPSMMSISVSYKRHGSEDAYTMKGIF